MKDEYRFVTAIHIDNQKFPEIKEDNLGSLIAGYVEKIAVKRVKAFDSAIIDNIREIGRENGIDLLAVIDEEKLLNMAFKLEKQDKVLKIIKENLVVSYDESENDKPCLVLGFKFDKDKMAIIYHTFKKEKIDLLKEVLL